MPSPKVDHLGPVNPSLFWTSAVTMMWDLSRYCPRSSMAVSFHLAQTPQTFLENQSLGLIKGSGEWAEAWRPQPAPLPFRTRCMCLSGDSEHQWKGGSMGAGSWERHLRQLGFCAAAESQHTAAIFLASLAWGQGNSRSITLIWHPLLKEVPTGR